MKSKTGFIIQARENSSRLPGKILLKEFNGKNVLNIISENINNTFKKHKCIISTGNINNNKKIVSFCKNNNLLYFCGSEDDVLSRFIDTAEYFELDRIIRICSDNLFLNMEYMKALIDVWDNDIDYLSYKDDELPVIKTHYGFFAECVTRDALIKIAESKDIVNTDKEHVTAYIYNNKDKFNIKYLNIPDILKKLTYDLRLTLDTPDDLKIIKEIFNYTGDTQNIAKILDYIENNVQIKNIMAETIKLQIK